jgi:hypothetical protein
MNDHDIVNIVRSATLDPEPGELDRIRQRIVDDAAGIRSVGGERDGTDRSWVRSVALVAAVVVFLAVAVGAMTTWRGDTGAPADRPDPTTVPPPTTAPPPTMPSAAPPTVLDGVTGTWLLTSVDGTPWSGPSVPLVRVDGAELVGWDGCNGGSWPSATADSLGPSTTTLVQCANAVPAIFGATTLTLDDEASLQLDGPTGEFGFVALTAGIVPTRDELVGPWKLGDTMATVSSDAADDRLVFRVGTCDFALETDGTVLVPVAGPSTPAAACVGPDAVGFADALADTSGRLAAVVIDDVLYLTVGSDALVPSEAYALVRASGDVPSRPALGAVALERGEVFGLGPDWSGEAVPPDQTADDALAVIGASLGPVGVDTGWYELELADVSGDPQCLAGAEYRVLWWGDLSVAFRRFDGVELLWTWSVGDRRASGFGDRGEPTVDGTGAPTGLVTEAGIGVGSTVEELSAAFADRLIETDSVDADGSVRYVSAGGQWPGLTNSSIGFTVRDGVVTGYATTLSLC